MNRGFSPRTYALLASTLQACSSFSGGEDVLGGDPTQTTQQSLPDPWWCLGQDPIARESSLGKSGNTQVALRLPIIDQFTQAPPESGMQGRFCSSTDLGCTRPVVDWMPLPADGRLSALVSSGFAGYAELRGSGYPNILFIVDTPVLRDLELYAHALVSIEGVMAIGQVLMQPVLQPNAGLLVASVLNCDGDAAEGVHIELSSGGQPVVLLGGIPVAGGRDTARDGVVIFNQVPPGPARVRVTLPDGRLVREQAVDVRGGWYSGLYLRPIVYSAEELCSIDGARPQPGHAEFIGRLRVCERDD
ncbi:MAG: hypothetical protein RL033_6010 [Pseudomonadota bacterium]|jgi:hypothetical protein